MKYELMVILDPSKTDPETEKLLAEIKALFAENGYTLTDEDIWGVRPTAYKIKGWSKGYYAVLLFEGEGQGMATVKQELRIMQGVLRTLIVKMPEDYVLMRYDGSAPVVDGKPKLSKHAEELSKKVTQKSEEKKEEEAADKEEKEKKLNEQLKAIMDDEDIKL